MRARGSFLIAFFVALALGGGAAVADFGDAPKGSNATSLQGISVATTTPSNTQVLTYSSTAGKWQPGTGAGSTAVAGDLTGTVAAATVAKINGAALGTTTGASSHEPLAWSGSAWAPDTALLVSTVGATTNGSAGNPPLTVGAGGTCGIYTSGSDLLFSSNGTLAGGFDSSQVLTLAHPLAIAQGGIGAATATANYLFAGPTFGGAAAPSFRAMVAADIPSGFVGASMRTLGFAVAAIGGGATGYLTSNNAGNASGSDLVLTYTTESTTVQRLFCSVTTAPGGLDSITFAVRTSVDGGGSWGTSSMTCQISGVNKGCTDFAHAFTETAGNALGIRAVQSLGSSAAGVVCAIAETN